MASGAAAAQAADPGIPPEIQVLAGNNLFLEAHATGVQIYACVAVADGYGWSAPTPRANLYGDNGKLVACITSVRRGKPGTAARWWAGRRRV